MTIAALRHQIEAVQIILRENNFETCPLSKKEAFGLLFKTFPQITSFEFKVKSETNCRLMKINNFALLGDYGVVDALGASALLEQDTTKSLLVEMDVTENDFFYFCDTLYDLIYILSSFLGHEGCFNEFNGVHQKENYE